MWATNTKYQPTNSIDFNICSRTPWPLGERKKSLTSNTCDHANSEKIVLWEQGKFVSSVKTLGPSDDGDDCKHIIVSSDVTALKGMLLPSQVTLHSFPHHFSPVLNSRPRPLSFNYLPLLSARLRPAGVRHSPELRLWPQLLVPVSVQNCTKQQKKKGKMAGTGSWSLNRLCLSKAGATQSENLGLRPRVLKPASLVSMGLLFSCMLGTRSQQDTYVPVYNQINRFRDQCSSTAGRGERRPLNFRAIPMQLIMSKRYW